MSYKNTVITAEKRSRKLSRGISDLKKKVGRKRRIAYKNQVLFEKESLQI